MSQLRPPARPISDLRLMTPARVGLGRAGSGLPTQALLAFTLDHARARDAIHTAFDCAGIAAAMQTLGLGTLKVTSRAGHRPEYLRRPDLGRQLDSASEESLGNSSLGSSGLVIVIGDGLSPAAVNAYAVDLIRHLIPRLAANGIEIGATVVASGARVALGDAIGALLGARLVVMLIGERPGLSAPQSMGAYLTFAPRPGLTDADRNCISNIHA
ncbi:MAG: ethanolamine ammonia-lyase subunit EutC, partial [Proteobacteria bacterium]|nr:ethanolamine ammonia-lyase subunit EutC [Pseudomonadota bacterium]